MKSLSGLVLPDSLQWIDRLDWTPVAQETGRTLSGALVVWSQQLTSGQPITLEAEDRITWLTTQQVQTLNTLAAQTGATYTLIWESETMTVMFRNHEPPTVLFKPLWPNYHLYTGTIKLMKV